MQVRPPQVGIAGKSLATSRKWRLNDAAGSVCLSFVIHFLDTMPSFSLWQIGILLQHAELLKITRRKFLTKTEPHLPHYQGRDYSVHRTKRCLDRDELP